MDTANNDLGTELYAWEAAEFTKPDRPMSWYLIGGLVAILIAGYFVWQGLYVTAATVIVIGIVIYLVGRMEPRHLRYQLTSQGVGVGTKLYPYAGFTGFWVVRTPETITLNLGRKGKITTNLSLPIEGADIDKIRETLVRYIPEIGEAGEDNLDKMSRLLKL